MAESTTGTNITNTNPGVISKISSAYANVRRLSSDPAVQKTIPLANAFRRTKHRTAIHPQHSQ